MLFRIHIILRKILSAVFTGLPVCIVILYHYTPLENLSGFSLSTDIPYVLILLFHLSIGVIIGAHVWKLPFPWPKKGVQDPALRGVKRVRARPHKVFKGGDILPEILLTLTTALFLFSWLYALNANMDYVQRFIEETGRIRLAVDTSSERLDTLIRYMPLIMADVLFYILTRRNWKIIAGFRKKSIRHKSLKSRKNLKQWLVWVTTIVKSIFSEYGLLLTIFSAWLFSLGFPSEISLSGFPIAGLIGLVPFLLCLEYSSFKPAVLYGTVFGVFLALFVTFWLATFQLLAIQFGTVVWGIEFFLFFLVLKAIYQRSGKFRWLLVPVAWTVFGYTRSLGFLGFLWALPGATQYTVPQFLQISAFTGVWGVNFLVIGVNCFITYILYLIFETSENKLGISRILRPSVVLGAGIIIVAIAGQFRINWLEQLETKRTVRFALIQQNSDPRKGSYKKHYDVLKRLTDKALKKNPDLVVWPETAFVPCIRYYSSPEGQNKSRAELVKEMRTFQEKNDTHLITGNDDYVYSQTEEGKRIRTDYNASLYFTPEGMIKNIYHKIRLVPFTEYYPFEEIFPAGKELLEKFDVYLWEPGSEYTVFEHPKIKFSTPICFEDTFPGHIRNFVKKGAEAIVVLSNDYWSLTEVEGQQHYAHAMIRAVETGKPLIRSTTSGLTSYVTAGGILKDSLPFYTADYLITNVSIKEVPKTFYVKHGNWFPLLNAAILIVWGLSVILGRGIFLKKGNLNEENSNGK